ncbi:carbohydrate kinase [Arsenicitalea aurantiaca]|uniref:Carbohydrate kinase n=1 Tax=Arsenicitalea aurantiaca TaxID=1783274 RepID=A0A433XK42_9HYPH|nr:carbohydrate kinase [Arsenicitalea aurantiaca]RUT34440.1 carbohydrate kinase [Arsenicitalea aurantiaca]
MPMFVVGGESLIDLVSEPTGPDGVIRMTAHQGGSPYNCAIALARLGMESGFLCPISKDGFGTYLMGPLEAAGVRPLLVERVAAPSTLAVVTLDARGAAQYEFYRGADRAFTREGLIAALPERPALFQIGGFCPILPEDAEVWLDVAEAAAARGATLSIDPNVRPSLVADFEAYRARLDRFLDIAHLIKLSEEDLAALDPQRSIAAHAAALLERPNCEMVVVTLGEKGSRAFTAAGEAEAGIYRPAVFGDTVGAGDSLMAGVLTHLAEAGALVPGRLGATGPEGLDAMLRFGAVVAGLNCAEKGCRPPSREAVEGVLGGGLSR